MISLICLQNVDSNQKPKDDKPESSSDDIKKSNDNNDDANDDANDDDIKWLAKCAYPPHRKEETKTVSGNHDQFNLRAPQ